MTADLSGLPVGEVGVWWVYAHRAADGSTLYVGCSQMLHNRQSQHRSTAPWWPEVDRVVTVIGPFADRREALDAERSLIRELEPPHNIIGTPREVAVYAEAARKAAAHREARRRGPDRETLEYEYERLTKKLDEVKSLLAALDADSAGAA